MNRGSVLTAQPLSIQGTSFNEAPIHESGKYAMQPRGQRLGQGFNEAPIHESGKWPSAMDAPYP